MEARHRPRSGVPAGDPRHPGAAGLRPGRARLEGRRRRAGGDNRLRPMRAAVCRAYGPPEAVSVEDVPAPALAADQVRVRVAAAAVNFPDVLVVADSYQMSAPLPFVPGSELAGVVTNRKAVGEGKSVTVRVDSGWRAIHKKKKP